MKAKAAVFMGANVPFEVREFEITDTPAGYGRSELIASGICGTDVHFHNGKLSVAAPTIIGHEFVGRLVDLNEEEGKRYGLKKGDRVIADIAVPCGECLLCKSGDDANCVRMRVTNGGSIETPPYLFGGYTRVNYTPLSNLIRIPEQLDAEMVCIFACPGPTAMHAFALAGRAGVDLADIRTAVVQGLGPVGTYAVMYLKAMGVKQVFAITAGTNARREELAKSLGASEVFNLSRTGAAQINESIVKASGGLGADLAFEASGAPMGYMVQKGFFDTIPASIDEAARIDGATNFTVFRKIILPLSMPIIVYTALTSFTWPWSDFILPKLLLKTKDTWTVAVGLMSLGDTEFSRFAAGSIFIAVPIVVLYFVLVRYMINGMAAGAVKE